VRLAFSIHELRNAPSIDWRRAICKDERGKHMFKKLAFIALIVISGMVGVAPVLAQNTVWRIDS
jgi:hypothetical protein